MGCHWLPVIDSELICVAGLLGIALANEEYADEAVQTPLVAAACSYLQKAVLNSKSTALKPAAVSGQGSFAGKPQQPAAATSPAASNLEPSQQPPAASAAVTLPPLLVAAANNPELLAGDVLQVRFRRLLGVIKCLTCTGEYVEALSPFLTHQGVECCCVLLQVRLAELSQASAWVQQQLQPV